MGVLPTDEDAELAAGLRRFLSESLSLAQVRRLSETDTGFDASVWKVLSEQFDLIALAVPERLGGAGAGQRTLAVVAQEMGRALCCLPYFSTAAMALPVLIAAGDGAGHERWLPGLTDGSVRASLAICEPGAVTDAWTVQSLETTATGSGASVTLDGQKTFVIDGVGADVLFVLAASDAGPALYAVESGAPGLTRTALATLDRTRKQAQVSFAGCPATPLGAAEPALATARELATLFVAMEQVGAAEACLEMATEYARTRSQFGRKIGSFQAIKHRCADMFVALESARAAALHAAWVADFAPARLPVAVAAAKTLASEALLACAKGNIQVHGGIGVTAEHNAHLYYRRAQSANLMFGSPAEHRKRLAGLLEP